MELVAGTGKAEVKDFLKACLQYTGHITIVPLAVNAQAIILN